MNANVHNGWTQLMKTNKFSSHLPLYFCQIDSQFITQQSHDKRVNQFFVTFNISCVFCIYLFQCGDSPCDQTEVPKEKVTRVRIFFITISRSSFDHSLECFFMVTQQFCVRLFYCVYLSFVSKFAWFSVCLNSLCYGRYFNTISFDMIWFGFSFQHLNVVHNVVFHSKQNCRTCFDMLHLICWWIFS